MAICSQCQAPLKPGKRFCTNCGIAVPATPLSPDRQPEPQIEAPSPRCAHCNAPLKPGKNFCTACGMLALPLAEAAPPAEIVFTQERVKPTTPLCAQCHAPLKPGRRFCSECGAPTPSERQPPLSPPAPPRATAQPVAKVEVVITGDATSQRQGFGPRFNAALIDGVILFGLALMLGFVFRFQLLMPVLLAAYYYLEVILGYTPGKRVGGLVVLQEDGTKATPDVLKKRWQLKVGLTSLINLLTLMGTDLGFPSPLIYLLQVPSLLIVAGCFSIFGATRQTFYDKMAKTAVFSLSLSGSLATDATSLWQELQTAWRNLGQYLKKSSGIFDAQGTFSFQGALLFPVRIVQARSQSFLRGFLIGGGIHLLVVSLSGGFGDVATFPSGLFIPTKDSIFFPVALAIWGTASAVITYFLNRRRASRIGFKAAAWSFWITWLTGLAWAMLTTSDLLADDGGLSELGSNPTGFIEEGGVALVGQSGGTGLVTGIGAGAGAGAGSSSDDSASSSASSLTAGGVTAQSSPQTSGSSAGAAISSSSVSARSSDSSVSSSLSSALSSHCPLIVLIAFIGIVLVIVEFKQPILGFVKLGNFVIIRIIIVK